MGRSGIQWGWLVPFRMIVPLIALVTVLAVVVGGCVDEEPEGRFLEATFGPIPASLP